MEENKNIYYNNIVFGSVLIIEVNEQEYNEMMRSGKLLLFCLKFFGNSFCLPFLWVIFAKSGFELINYVYNFC